MTRFFVHKAWLGGAGLVIGLLGMATAQRWLVWVAVAMVAAAFLLRLAERSAHVP
jgi:membrane protein implicated in regulation of membrane protease activity